MDIEQAKRRILIHAGFLTDDEKSGLIRRLRPYIGVREHDFADVLESLVTLHPDVVSSSTIDRELCAALWHMCVESRRISVGPQSALRRNKIADEAVISRIALWMGAFEDFSVKLLCGLDIGYCVLPGLQTILATDVEDPANFAFVLPVLKKLVLYEDDDVVEVATKALSILS